MAVQRFKAELSKNSLQPIVHVVLGSGFGTALDEAIDSQWRDGGRLPFTEIPDLPKSTVQDHAGVFRFFEHRDSKRTVIFQCGRLHGYEGHTAAVAVRPVMLSRLVGVERFLLTNAAGGIDANHRVGDVMLIRDHVNFTGQNPLVGENPRAPSGPELGPRFPDMSQIYDPHWRAELRASFEALGVRVHHGIYLGLLGPSFETPAEIQLFASWGAQAVGMSTVWEALALRHSGARVAALSLISNAACGLGEGEALDHDAILTACRASARAILKAILAWLPRELAK